MNLKQFGYILLIFLLTTVIFFFYFQIQPSIDYRALPMFDGYEYLKIYQYFKGTTTEYKVAFPINSRIGVPYLASLIPITNSIMSFQYVNYFFSILSILSLYLLWMKLKIQWYLILCGFVWLLFHWTGMIRLNQFDPVTVDLPLYFFHTILVYIIFSEYYKILWIVSPLAVIQKESFTVFVLILFLYSIYQNKFAASNKLPIGIFFIALLLCIATKFFIAKYFPPVAEGSSVRTVFFYVREIFFDPFKIIRWLVAIFTAFGAFLIMAIAKGKIKDKNNDALNLLYLFSLASIGLGLVAGADITRIIFLGFSFIMTAVLYGLNNTHPIQVIITLLLSIPFMRITSIIPNPVENEVTFKNWYPETAQPNDVIVWLAYILLCFAVVVFMNRKFQLNV